MSSTGAPTGSSRRASFVARRRRSLLFRKAAGLCRRYLEAWSNLNYDIDSNGESSVLRTVARFDPAVVLDVGANVGDWTLLARRHFPKAAIHSFEISPPTFATLSERCGGLANVTLHNFGVSDVAETISIRHYPDVPALTTSSNYPHPFEYREIPAETDTGDAFASRSALAHIDLLKIDVEGMEDRILRGFESMLSRRAIDLVQFEYGRVNILNHFLLRDFHAFFRERGYIVGKIYPDGVEFRDYQLADEDFLGPNYLACRSDRTDYLRALGCA